MSFYLKGILETIKYHFKFEAIKTDRDNYNIFLINEILKNTKKKRLYSRFGKFYKVDELNFNRITKPTTDTGEVEFAEAQQTAINPFTMQEVTVDNTQVVMFYPENQKRQPKTSPYAYELINYKQKEHYIYLLPQQNIKKILQNHFNAMFGKRAKIPDKQNTFINT